MDLLDCTSNENFKLYCLIIIFISLGWILYSIYNDFIENNDPDGRRVRTIERKLRRKQKLLKRLRRELKKQETIKKLKEENEMLSSSVVKEGGIKGTTDINNNVINTQSTNYDKPVVVSSPFNLSTFTISRRQSHYYELQDLNESTTTASEAEDNVKIIQRQIELNSSQIQNLNLIQKLFNKLMDFFSGEVVVPESDTDDENPRDLNLSFVMIQNDDPSLVRSSSKSYRKIRMNLIRQGHSWDPAL